MTVYIEKGYPFPLHLAMKENMTDEELFHFCEANKHLRLEQDENKQLVIMPPAGGETGGQHSEINYALTHWNKQAVQGKTFDSSTGFLLPDSSMRSPDVSWITIEKWNSLSKKERKRFLSFAPDFIVEVLSLSDHFFPAQEKMLKWIQNGVRLAWLVVPEQQTAFIYRANGTVDKVEGFDKTLSGEDVLPGFQFELSALL